jgi:hypothetical protein
VAAGVSGSFVLRPAISSPLRFRVVEVAQQRVGALDRDEIVRVRNAGLIFSEIMYRVEREVDPGDERLKT